MATFVPAGTTDFALIDCERTRFFRAFFVNRFRCFFLVLPSRQPALVSDFLAPDRVFRFSDGTLQVFAFRRGAGGASPASVIIFATEGTPLASVANSM